MVHLDLCIPGTATRRVMIMTLSETVTFEWERCVDTVRCINDDSWIRSFSVHDNRIVRLPGKGLLRRGKKPEQPITEFPVRRQDMTPTVFPENFVRGFVPATTKARFEGM
mmetsp:Transcript_22778/g.50565  ORF Transcript_22778/g.50565 Transcript_22778/m.50565 type:complete len:110 (-) Transcript_22778:71-400(-)